MKFLLASLLFLAFPEDEITVDRYAKLDDHLALGESIVQEHLTVWPILTDRPAPIGDLRTLLDAQRYEVVRIREAHYDSCLCVTDRFGDLARAPQGPFTGEGAARTGRNGASAIVVENSGTKAVFVPAGTVLQGGYRDQIVAQDAVIPEKTWASVESFPLPSKQRSTETPFFRCANRLAPGNLRRDAQFTGDSGALQSHFACLAKEARLERSASDFAMLSDREDSRARRFVSQIESGFARYFYDTRAEWVPIGFAYAINGKPMEIRTYAEPKLFRAQLPSHARAMSLEANLTPAQRWIATGIGSRQPDLRTVYAKLSLAKARLMSGGEASRFEIRECEAGYGSICYAKLPAGKDRLEWFVVSRDWLMK